MADFENAFVEEASDLCAESGDGIGVTIDDFRAYMPTHSYIFTPCREIWPASSIDARLPRVPVLDTNGQPMRREGKIVTIAASRWLDKNRPV
jgi:hypothetical protein